MNTNMRFRGLAGAVLGGLLLAIPTMSAAALTPIRNEPIGVLVPWRPSVQSPELHDRQVNRMNSELENSVDREPRDVQLPFDDGVQGIDLSCRYDGKKVPI